MGPSPYRGARGHVRGVRRRAGGGAVLPQLWAPHRRARAGPRRAATGPVTAGRVADRDRHCSGPRASGSGRRCAAGGVRPCGGLRCRRDRRLDCRLSCRLACRPDRRRRSPSRARTARRIPSSHPSSHPSRSADPTPVPPTSPPDVVPDEAGPPPPPARRGTPTRTCCPTRRSTTSTATCRCTASRGSGGSWAPRCWWGWPSCAAGLRHRRRRGRHRSRCRRDRHLAGAGPGRRPVSRHRGPDRRRWRDAGRCGKPLDLARGAAFEVPGHRPADHRLRRQPGGLRGQPDGRREPGHCMAYGRRRDRRDRHGDPDRAGRRHQVGLVNGYAKQVAGRRLVPRQPPRPLRRLGLRRRLVGRPDRSSATQPMQTPQGPAGADRDRHASRSPP